MPQQFDPGIFEEGIFAQQYRYALVETAMRSAFTAWWNGRAIPYGLTAKPLLIWSNTTAVPNAGGPAWIEPELLWSSGAGWGNPGTETYEEAGFIQTDIYVPAGSGWGAIPIIAGEVAVGWKAIRDQVLGLQVYRTSPPNSLPSPPEGYYGRHVTTSIRWVYGADDMTEETYLWSDRMTAGGTYAVGDCMVYGPTNTVVQSTGSAGERFAGIARNGGTAGSTVTLAKPPGMVYVNNGLGGATTSGARLDFGAAGQVVLATAGNSRTIGILAKSASTGDVRVLVDLNSVPAS